MSTLTADQAWMQIEFLRNLVQDPGEYAKLNNLILGAVESREIKKARMNAHLDKYSRYQFKPKKLKNPRLQPRTKA